MRKLFRCFFSWCKHFRHLSDALSALSEFISSIYLQFVLFSSTLFRTSVLQSKNKMQAYSWCFVSNKASIYYHIFLSRAFITIQNFSLLRLIRFHGYFFCHDCSFLERHFEVVNIMIDISTYKKIAKFRTVKFPPVWIRSVVHVWNLRLLSHFVSGFLLFALPGPTPRRPVYSNQIPD